MCFLCVPVEVPYLYLRGLDTLTVQCASRWVLVATHSLTHLSAKRVMEPLPCPIIAPLVEVGVHALPRRVLPRQHAPLTATDDNVQDRIDDRSHLQAARSSSRLCRRNQVFDTIPLTVGQIGWIQLVLFHFPSVPPRSPGCHSFSNSRSEKNC